MKKNSGGKKKKKRYILLFFFLNSPLYIYIYIYIYIYTHTHTHTYIHTQNRDNKIVFKSNFFFNTFVSFSNFLVAPSVPKKKVVSKIITLKPKYHHKIL